MKTSRQLQLASAALAALTISLSPLALAKPSGDMPWGQACDHESMYKSGKDGRPGAAAANFQAAAQQRLERLQSELKLSPAQQTAWQNFAGKMQQQAADMQTRLSARSTGDQVASATAHAPERMARGIEFMKQRLSSMENMQIALKELYGSLTPEQQLIADRHFQRSHHERRAGRHGQHNRGQHRH